MLEKTKTLHSIEIFPTLRAINICHVTQVTEDGLPFGDPSYHREAVVGDEIEKYLAEIEEVISTEGLAALAEVSKANAERDAAFSERDNAVSEYSELELQTSALIQGANLKIEQMQEEINRLTGLFSAQNEVPATEDK